MTISLEVPTRSMWLLSGQVDEGEPVRDIPLQALPFRVGRRPDASFRISSPTISNLHAEIIEREGELILVDLGSTNGTFVNGHRITGESRLQEGDLIQFANVVFRLKQQDTLRDAETLQGENCDRAMALIQFDRLMTERAVVPFFQPIVRSKDGLTVGYEVLGRSHLFGLKNPCVMFQAASQLNLEAELSRLCRRVGLEASCQLSDPKRLYLNTHPSELFELDVLQFSLQEIREAFPQLPVTLEIHEAAVTSPQLMRELHATLDDLGYLLAYDDFGAGQTRLIELIEVPPHVLKFDLALTRDIDQAPSQRQRMLASLVQIACDLGVETLAEGMETRGEAAACVQLGFTLSQGFYYGEPAPVEEYSGR